jgi:2-succinyl-5-enolpyruvyl-6-hydroxy-3-cyclohexene-1-carboxylate synthase
MPIRDFNSAFPPSEKSIRVFSNRGLSGIDGLVATAAGLSLAGGKDTHAILGDLSTLHDLSSLSLLAQQQEKLRLTLWVMNNGGGEIFRIVPTAKTAGRREWFTTPQAYDLSALAKAFRIPYLRLSSREDWEALEPGACAGPGARIVEVLVDRETNLAVRKKFQEME